MRIGIIQPLPGIGDMTWHVPAIRAIAAAAPDGKVTLFVKKSAQAPALFAGEPMVANVVALPIGRGLVQNIVNLWPMAQVLRRAGIDRLFILHRSARYQIAARLAGIRDIITYPPDLALSKHDGWVKSLALLEKLSIPVTQRHSSLTVSPESITAIKQRFAAYPHPWFILAPGASEASRRWPAERFAFCADALIERQGGTLFLTGAPGEADCVAAVQRQCKYPDKIITLTDLPFDQFMGLILCSEGMLGNCSGPVNVAATLGRPAFSLQAFSHAPQHSPNMILIKPDLPQFKDMQSISAEHALDSILSYFSDLKKAS